MIKPEKETQLTLRIDKELKLEFREMCQKRSINGSDLIRQFILSWVRAHKEPSL